MADINRAVILVNNEDSYGHAIGVKTSTAHDPGDYVENVMCIFTSSGGRLNLLVDSEGELKVVEALLAELQRFVLKSKEYLAASKPNKENV